MSDAKYGDYREYKKRREYRRKVRQLQFSMEQIARIIYPQTIIKVVWKHTKPRLRAHDPYARTGFISWKISVSE